MSLEKDMRRFLLAPARFNPDKVHEVHHQHECGCDAAKRDEHPRHHARLWFVMFGKITLKSGRAQKRNAGKGNQRICEILAVGHVSVIKQACPDFK